jgi:SRSO17 transposase
MASGSVGSTPARRVKNHQLPDRCVRRLCIAHGHALIDRALYLPKAWTDDPARMAGAHVPDGTGFATKPDLAITMIARAIAADVPFAWVAADSVYGVGAIERALRRAGKGYVLGVPGNHLFGSWDKRQPVAGTTVGIAHDIDTSLWRRLSAGDGTKGARFYDWPIANWPISMPLNTMTSARACGRAAC